MKLIFLLMDNNNINIIFYVFLFFSIHVYIQQYIQRTMNNEKEAKNLSTNSPPKCQKHLNKMKMKRKNPCTDKD